jgi:hypothetical protein
MTRDITEFATFGVLPANVTSLQVLCDAFEVFPTDEYINQEYLSAVEARDNIVNELQVIIRAMALRVELKWGKKSPKYKSLKIADLTRLSVDAYVTSARMVHAFMTEYLTELAAEGLTAPMLNDMEDKIQELDDAIRETIAKNSLRIEKTTERITKGNELYNLVSRYCEIGKRIWDGVNPAFFNDYIIYTSVSPGSLTAPQNLRYETDYMKVVWDAVENATSYQLEVSTDGVNFTELTTTTDPEFGFIPYDAHTYYKCRARNNSGYGPYSSVIDFWYYDPLPAPSNFQAEIIPGHECRLSWEMVHSATTYRVYISDVAFGEPEGPFIPFLNTGQLEYTTSLTPGRRMYFKVTCFNPYQAESGFSNTSYVEVTGGTP